MTTTKKQTIQNIKLSELAPSPVNQRTLYKKDSGIMELAGSIKEQGLLQPIVVRPICYKDFNFEIVAGERRFRAFKLLKRETIPALVQPMTDQEAHEATATENLQREDLTPLEEANSIKVLIDEGREIKEIADRLGKSPRWVIRRANLSKLAPCWTKAIADPKNPVSKWGALHLEIISRYDKNKQESILESLSDDCEDEVATTTTAELEKYLAEHSHTLSSAPWKTTDETIVPGAGACTACNTRSSCVPDLFDDQSTKKADKKDFCLDDACWAKKLLAHNTAKIAELKEKHNNLILLSDDYGRNTALPDDHPWKDSLDHSYNYGDSSKKDKKAIPAYVVDGDGAGHVKYVKPWNTASSMSGCSKSLSSGKPKTLSERREALKKRRVVRYITKILQLLDGNEPVHCQGKEKTTTKLSNSWKVPGQLLSHAELFRLIVSLGAAQKECETFHSQPWKIYEQEINTPEAVLFEDVLNGVFVKLRDQLKTLANYNPSKEKADLICTALYLDSERLWNMVLEEIQEPKIWKTLNADGTNKTAAPAKKKPKKKAASTEKAAR